MAQQQITVLIVDDSAFMRKLITDFLSGTNRIKIVGTARNGKEAIDKVKDLQPDVVTLDVEMPIMNGLDVLKWLMSEYPVPVVMLSSTTQENAKNTVLAMQYGAVDFIAKPSGAISLDLHKIKDDLIHKVIMASKANVRGTPANIRSKPAETQSSPAYQSEWPTRQRNKMARKIVCIGTSTGGPRALQAVLTKLPSDFDAPILIVQHMPAGFTKSLADRLNTLCAISVKEAEDGDVIQRGTAYIAPGGFHITTKLVGTSVGIQLSSDPPRSGHRPSVDMMFESVSMLKNYQKVAVIMTGMGADGAKGLNVLKSSGSTIAIAEAEASSVVFGMPKAAIATNLVDEVVHLDKISNAILKHVHG
ncbi:chemotaxis response regulator protein-glutamate methylesterase [Bacillus tianshenii]|nr:chemotaxis response regulator protein-glutamate methylesterase [Bacillus tianshenii]